MIYHRGIREPNGPTGGMLVGILVRPHPFSPGRDNAGSICSICFGWRDDTRHTYTKGMSTWQPV
jgi:hypothetical protein